MPRTVIVTAVILTALIGAVGVIDTLSTDHIDVPSLVAGTYLGAVAALLFTVAATEIGRRRAVRRFHRMVDRHHQAGPADDAGRRPPRSAQEALAGSTVATIHDFEAERLWRESR